MPPPKQRGSQAPPGLNLADDQRQENPSFRVPQSRMEHNPFRFLPQKSQASLEARMRSQYGASLQGRSTAHSFLGPPLASWASQQGPPFHTSLALARTYHSMPSSQRRLVDKSDIHYSDTQIRGTQQYDRQHTSQHYIHQEQVQPRIQMYNREYLQQQQPVTPIQDNIILQNSSQFTIAASEAHNPLLVEQPIPYANDIDSWVRPRPPVFPHIRKQLEAQSSSEDSGSHPNQVQAELPGNSLSAIGDKQSQISASPIARKVTPVRENNVEPHGIFNPNSTKNDDTVRKDDRYEAMSDQKDDSSKKKRKVSTNPTEGKPKHKRKTPVANKATKSRKQITIKLTNRSAGAKAGEAGKGATQPGEPPVCSCNCSCGPNNCESTLSTMADDLAGSTRTAQKAVSGKIYHASLATDTMVLHMDIEELIDLALRRGDAGVLPQLSLDIFAKAISNNDNLWEQIEPLMDGLRGDIDQ